MTCDDIIAAAQDAIGGLERLRSIRTYHAEIRRTRANGRTSSVSIWRAAGGRIRVEEAERATRTVRIANGTAGSFDEAERAELLRDARIAPRNMLAHAGEYDLALRERAAPDGTRIVSFPAEFVLYLFDPATFLCKWVIDLVRNRRTELGDYKVVDAIRTPFIERHIAADPLADFDDRYVRVAYNLELDDELFDPAASSQAPRP